MKTLDELKRDPYFGILADYEDLPVEEAWEAHEMDKRAASHKLDEDDVRLGFIAHGQRVRVE